jgi:hypothetical protein
MNNMKGDGEVPSGAQVRDYRTVAAALSEQVRDGARLAQIPFGKLRAGFRFAKEGIGVTSKVDRLPTAIINERDFS